MRKLAWLVLLAAAGMDTDLSAAETAKTTLISTGVYVQRLAIDPSGNFACVFGQQTQGQPESSLPLHAPPTHVVAIDLKKGSVVSQTAAVGEVRFALADDQQILWIPKNVNVLRRIKFDGSGRLEEHVLTAPVMEMFGLGPERFVIVQSDADRQFSVRDRTTLAEVPAHALSRLTAMEHGRGRIVTQLGDGMLYVDDRVINVADGETRCFVMDESPPVRIGGVKGNISFVPLYAQPDIHWRRFFEQGEVKQFNGPGSISLRTYMADISESHPLVATVEKVATNYGQKLLLNVELQDLVYGQVLRRIEFPDKIESYQGSLPRNSEVQFAGNSVVVAVRDQVFDCQLPPRYLDEDVLEPLRLIFPVLPSEDVSKPITMQLTAKGGKPPYRFVAAMEMRDISVNGTTGLVSVDVPKIWETYCNNIGRDPFAADAHDVTIGGVFMWDHLALAPKDDTVYVSIPMLFAVTDQSGQSDKILATFVGDAPSAEVKAAAAKARDESQQRRREWKEALLKRLQESQD